MDDLAPFESSKLVIARAEEHLRDFKAEARAFLQGCTYAVVRRIDEEAGEQVLSYRFDERIPPRLRLLSSEIVAGCKHALDQAASDAAIATGRPNAKGVHFPIGASSADFQNEIKRRLRNVRPEIIAFIEKLQTYYGGNTALYKFLSLAGVGKHQRILRIFLDDVGVVLTFDPRVPMFIPGPFKIAKFGWNDARNEVDFLRAPLDKEYAADFRPALQIVLGDGEPPLGGPAATVFKDMVGECERIILGLEAEAARIRTAP